MLSDVLRDASEKIRALLVHQDGYIDVEVRLKKLLAEMDSLRCYLEGPPPFEKKGPLQ